MAKSLGEVAYWAYLCRSSLAPNREVTWDKLSESQREDWRYIAQSVKGACSTEEDGDEAE